MKQSGTRFLERIQSPDSGPVLLVAAHPDDEVIGAGSILPRLSDLWIVHVTDGAPRDMRDAARHGFGARSSYARARREELRAALEVAGVSDDRALEIGIPDQEAALDLAGLSRALSKIILALSPDLVLAHPYEGGHPDHDAAAFGVSAACRLLRAQGVAPPLVWEMTSYHDGPTGIRVFEFLPNGGDVEDKRLDEAEQALKQRMLRCFKTQQETLRVFPTQIERFRPAPGYDFARPPHEGTLFYERFAWGMTGDAFRLHARRALDELGLRAAA